MVRRIAVAALGAVALTAVVASAAPAAQLTQSYWSAYTLDFYSSLTYTADPGEYNRVAVDSTGTGDNAESVTWYDRLAPIAVHADPIQPPVQVINSYTTWGCDSVNANTVQCASFLGYACRVSDCDGFSHPGFTPIRIDTGDADDIVYAQDGQPEDITCGTGTDQAFVDPTDTVAADCERVTRSG